MGCACSTDHLGGDGHLAGDPGIAAIQLSHSVLRGNASSTDRGVQRAAGLPASTRSGETTSRTIEDPVRALRERRSRPRHPVNVVGLTPSRDRKAPRGLPTAEANVTASTASASESGFRVLRTITEAITSAGTDGPPPALNRSANISSENSRGVRGPRTRTPHGWQQMPSHRTRHPEISRCDRPSLHPPNSPSPDHTAQDRHTGFQERPRRVGPVDSVGAGSRR